jgi:holo-[acyl-carrier protein] synthase
MSNGLHHIMILPISTRSHEAKAFTAPPQGLILRESLRPLLLEEATAASGGKAGMGATGEAGSRFDINAVDGQFCEVSISHDDNFAQAVALVPKIDWAEGDMKRTYSET